MLKDYIAELKEELEDAEERLRELEKYVDWVRSFLEFNGDTMRELAAQFMALAEEEGRTAPLLIGHRLIGINLLYTGDIAQGRAYLDQSIALFNPLVHIRRAEPRDNADFAR